MSLFWLCPNSVFKFWIKSRSMSQTKSRPKINYWNFTKYVLKYSESSVGPCLELCPDSWTSSVQRWSMPRLVPRQMPWLVPWTMSRYVNKFCPVMVHAPTGALTHALTRTLSHALTRVSKYFLTESRRPAPPWAKASSTRAFSCRPLPGIGLWTKFRLVSRLLTESPNYDSTLDSIHALAMP